jgi:CheY-like chemotaxis protein
MPKTLLLADDSVTIQKVVGISFANEDIVLLTVDNGDDAIARAREARPDVVLADVVMPGKNGYDVCQAIKSEPSLAHIPVLLLTGTFEAFDEQRAARVGADGHITKPFEAQALVDKVNALLARPREAAAGDAPAAAPAPSAARGVEIGTLRPAAVPAPQPVSHTADTAYDFFDEEAPAAAPAPAAAASEPAREDTTLLLGGEAAERRPEDGGFAFEDMADTEREPALPPRAAAPETPPSAAPGFGGDDFALELAGPGEAEGSLFDDFAPAPASAPAAAPDRDAFAEPGGSFEWDAPAPAPPARPDDVTRYAFDAAPPPAPPAAPEEVTRYHFDAPEAPAAAAPEPVTPEWFAPAPPQDATRLLTPEPEPERFALPDPDAGAGDLELEAAFEAGAALGEAVLDPRSGRDYDVSSSDLGPPLAVTLPPAAARAAEPQPEPAPRSAAASAAGAGLGRSELHDALEKLAWEAFGPVAENLVREAVERIERIAWEVIPQMAEALIKEEIRKLKGD